MGITRSQQALGWELRLPAAACGSLVILAHRGALDGAAYGGPGWLTFRGLLSGKGQHLGMVEVGFDGLRRTK